MKHLLTLLIFLMSIWAISCSKPQKLNNESKKDACSNTNLITNLATHKNSINFSKCFELNKAYPETFSLLSSFQTEGFNEFHKNINQNLFVSKDSRRQFTKSIKKAFTKENKDIINRFFVKLKESNLVTNLIESFQNEEQILILNNILKSFNYNNLNDSINNLLNEFIPFNLEDKKVFKAVVNNFTLSNKEIINLFDAFTSLNQNERENLLTAIESYFKLDENQFHWIQKALHKNKIEDIYHFFKYHRFELDNYLLRAQNIIDTTLACNNSNDKSMLLTLETEAKYAVNEYLRSKLGAQEIFVELQLKLLYIYDMCPSEFNPQIKKELDEINSFLKYSTKLLSNDTIYYITSSMVSAVNVYYKDDLGFLKFRHTNLYRFLTNLIDHNFLTNESVLDIFNFLKQFDGERIQVLKSVVLNLLSKQSLDLFFEFWKSLSEYQKNSILDLIKLYINDFDAPLAFSKIYLSFFENFKNYFTLHKNNNLNLTKNYLNTLISAPNINLVIEEHFRLFESGTFWHLIDVISLEAKFRDLFQIKDSIRQALETNLVEDINDRCINELTKFETIEQMYTQEFDFNCLKSGKFIMQTLLKSLNDDYLYVLIKPKRILNPKLITTLMSLAQWIKRKKIIKLEDTNVDSKHLVDFYTDANLNNLFRDAIDFINDWAVKGDLSNQIKQINSSKVASDGGLTNINDLVIESLNNIIDEFSKDNNFKPHRREFDCSIYPKNIGFDPCPANEIIAQKINEIIDLIYKKVNAPHFIDLTFDLLNKDKGLLIPVKKGKMTSLDLVEFLKFILDFTDEKTNQTIIYNQIEGAHEVELNALMRLEMIIREIGFNDNYYSSYFKNEVAKAKNYVKKVRGLRKYAIGLDKLERIYRSSGSLDLEVKYRMKNVLNTFDALIDIGLIQSSFSDKVYVSEIQSIIGLTVKASDKKTQSYLPVNPSASFIKNHKGKVITLLTDLFALNNVGSFIRTFFAGQREIVLDPRLKTILDKIITKIDAKVLIDTFENTDSKNRELFIQDMVKNIRNLSLEESQRLERIAFEVAYLFSNSNIEKINEVIELLPWFLKNYHHFRNINFPKIILSYDLIDSSVKGARRFLQDNPGEHNRLYLELVEFIPLITKYNVDEMSAKKLEALMNSATLMLNYIAKLLKENKDILVNNKLVDKEIFHTITMLLEHLVHDDEFRNDLYYLFTSKTKSGKILFDEILISLLTKENVDDFFFHINPSIKIVK